MPGKTKLFQREIIRGRRFECLVAETVNSAPSPISNDITDRRYDVEFAISAKLSSAMASLFVFEFLAADLTEMSLLACRGAIYKYKINKDSLRLWKLC